MKTASNCLIANENWEKFFFFFFFHSTRHKSSRSSQSSFINVPHFPQWKVFNWQAQEWKRKTFGNETLLVSLLSYFFLWLFFYLTRAHTHTLWGKSFWGAHPLPSMFYGCCFSFSFSQPEFSLRKFFHFLFVARVERFFHCFRLTFVTLFTRTWMIARLRSALWAFSDENQRGKLTNFTFSPYHFASRLSLFFPFSYITAFFIGKCRRQNAFHVSTLSLFRRSHALNSRSRFSRNEKKNIFIQ